MDPGPVAEQCEHFFLSYFISSGEQYTSQCLRKFGVGRGIDLTLDLNYVRSDRVGGLIIFLCS